MRMITDEMWQAVLAVLRVGVDALENLEGDPEQEKWEAVLELARKAYPRLLEAHPEPARDGAVGSRHSFLVTVQQRDDLHPVTEAELMRAVGYRITEGWLIDLIEIVPAAVVLDREDF